MPVFRAFISEYLRSFHGPVEELEKILQLVIKLPPYQFEELSNEVLHPIAKLFSTSSIKQKSLIIDSYTSLLRNWVSIHWLRFYNISEDGGKGSLLRR